MKRETSVLLLDDDKLPMTYYQRALLDSGFAVTFINDIPSALEAIDSNTFDIAIIDLMMSAGGVFDETETEGGYRTGLAFARRLRYQSPQTKLVVLTNANAPEVMEWCKEHDAAFYHKTDMMPFDLARLVKEISLQLGKDIILRIETILQRFHDVAMQLQKRHDNRPTLVIEDEYDIQDLLHALLIIDYDDVRTEEWTPSYAGGHSRADFLLKNEQVVIEVKLAGDKLKEKHLGQQLTLDIANYVKHPDCGTLVCFIYDPAHNLTNRTGLQKDLEELGLNNLNVAVRIYP